jgi:glycerol uptake facilitator-like aquaporin
VRNQLVAEAIGTFFLLAPVVGSGIMAESLAGGNAALALLGNTLATGAILVVLITALGPISGAHFNPAVTLSMVILKRLTLREAVGYISVQILAGLLGMLAAHFMFDLDLIQFSERSRTGPPQWFSEGLATFGLVMTIIATVRFRPDFVATAVGLYITAAYWFTASTSFANPAVTVARSLTNTFSGIQPDHAGMFIVMQLLGALLATLLMRRLLNDHQ